MRIGGEFNEVRIEFGEADKDGDVRVRVEIDFNSRREYFFVSQEELKELIIHLQKQLRRQSDNNP